VIIAVTRLRTITYKLLGLVIKRSSNIVSLFKVLKNIRIDAWFLSKKDGVILQIGPLMGPYWL
jgi:hypothetical protein